MPKAFLIRKKLSAKDFLQQNYWQPDTPPPSPEELNGNRVRRTPAQSQLAQLSSNGEQPLAGPSGLSINTKHNSVNETLKSKILASHILSTANNSTMNNQLSGSDFLKQMAPSAALQRMILEEQLMKLNFENNNSNLSKPINLTNSLSNDQSNNMFPYDLSFKTSSKFNKFSKFLNNHEEKDDDEELNEDEQDVLDLSKTSSSHQYNKQKLMKNAHLNNSNNLLNQNQLFSSSTLAQSTQNSLQANAFSLFAERQNLINNYKRRYCNSATSASRSSSSTSSSPTFGVLDAYNSVVANGGAPSPNPLYNALCGAVGLNSASSASSSTSSLSGDRSPSHQFNNSMQCSSTTTNNQILNSIGQPTDLSVYAKRVPVIQSLATSPLSSINNSNLNSTNNNNSILTKNLNLNQNTNSSAISTSSTSSLISSSNSNLSSSNRSTNSSPANLIGNSANFFLTDTQIENGQQLIQMCQQNAGLSATAAIPKRFDEICGDVRCHLQNTLDSLLKRLSLPSNITPTIEFVNGGHGIKNPLLAMNLKMHTQIPVNQDDPLRCTVCYKRFTLQRLLNRHLKCHSDMKRYLCTFCAKGFNDTFDLKRHTRTHTGVRPYKCDSCDKSFTQRCSLESHTLKVHNIQHDYAYKERRAKMYVCEECGSTTNQPDVHFNHLKTQHPYSLALSKFNDKRHFKFQDQELSLQSN